MIPALPREQWPQHPRFRTQTLLLGAHEAFRNRSAWILDHLRALDPADQDVRRRRRWVSRMSTDFDWWMSGMRGHERYEEQKLYRYLEYNYGADFFDLEEGHRTLNVHRERVERAFRDATPGEADETRRMASLIDELESHRAVLLAHLHDEENLVIPMLLDLSPEKFKRYYNTPIRVLLGEP